MILAHLPSDGKYFRLRASQDSGIDGVCGQPQRSVAIAGLGEQGRRWLVRRYFIAIARQRQRPFSTAAAIEET